MSSNPCIKTGFRYIDSAANTVRCGDLHLDPAGAGLYVKGVHPQSEPASAALMGYVDAVVDGITSYAVEEQKFYQCTNRGIALKRVTQEFRDFVQEWSPSALPELRLADVIGVQPPYPEFCRHPGFCAGRSSCPRDPTCAD